MTISRASSRHSINLTVGGTAEQNYVADLIRASISAGSTVQRPQAIDWERLAECFRGHQLIIPLIWRLLDLSGAPQSMIAHLETSMRRYRLQSRLLLHELYRILPALERAHCAPLVLKGPALIHTVYGDVPRYFADLDLLVEHGMRARAGRVLEELGYRLDVAAPLPSHVYNKYHFHYLYSNAAGMAVELHWDLTEPKDYVRFDLEAWRARSRVITVGDVQLRVPSDADQLMHAASQCLDNAFVDLRRIVDAAMLIRASAADDTVELAKRARACNVATPLWVLLRLSRDIAGVGAHTLEAALRPALPVRACLESLELEKKSLALFVNRRGRGGLARLVRWLCAPNLAAGLRELGLHIVPRGWALAALKLDPDHLPARGFHLKLLPVRLWSFVKIIGYQVWCLGRSAIRYPFRAVLARRGRFPSP